MPYTPRHAAPRRRAIDLQMITAAMPSGAARRGSAGLAATAVIAGGVVVAGVAGVAATPEPRESAAPGPSDATPTSHQSASPDPDLALVSGAATRAGALVTPGYSPKHRRSDAVPDRMPSAATTPGTAATSEPAPAPTAGGAHRRSTTEPSPQAEATPTAEPSPTPSDDPSEEATPGPLGGLGGILDGLGDLVSPSAAPQQQ